jgi:pimeloyl-ACP methyl ester carboxylesterase
MLVKTKSFTLAVNAKGNPDSEKLALVLPGKLDSKDYAHMQSHVDLLSSLGFFAVTFDPPGTWESPGDISLYTTTNYLRAIDELIEHFGNKPTFVVGHSRGGSMATYSGITNSKIYAFAAIMSYVYKKDAKARDEDKFREKGFIESFRDLPPGGGERVKKFVLPLSFLEDQKQYVMDEKIKTCIKPKLFIAGKHDVLVPPETVRESFGLAAKPKEFYEIDSPHDYRLYPDAIKQVNKVIEGFLRKYNQN